jgi:5-methylcytosine-specific restriction endonuclease McrA
MKTCSKCHVEKTLSEFPKRASSPDGYGYSCKVCNKVYHKQYSAEHKEEFKGYTAKWHEKHPEYQKQYDAKWRAENIEAAKAIRENRRVRVVCNGGSFTEDDWNVLLLLYDFKCLACGRDDVLLTADHVIPVAFGGSSDISNIQPLCKSCNSIKGTHYIDYRLDAEEMIGE